SYVNNRFVTEFTDYFSLHRFSVERTADFWQAVADFCDLHWITPPTDIYTPPLPGKMRGAKWFGGASLNFAQNLLRHQNDGRTMIVSHAEGRDPVYIDGQSLRISVARCAHALRRTGVGKGDRVA